LKVIRRAFRDLVGYRLDLRRPLQVERMGAAAAG